MTREELERLPETELVEMVLSQQAQIEKLLVTLSELEAKLSEAEAQRSHLARLLEKARAREETEEQATFERQWEQVTRDALRHLDDVVYLAQSPLAELMVKRRSVQLEGLELQEELLAAIEDMEPDEDSSRRPRQHRLHIILRMAYLEKKKVTETAQALAMSERQYYRELRAAIRKIAGHMQNQF